MKMEDMNNELDEVHKSLKTFANARKFVIAENKEIVKACRESINAAHAANAALPGAQSDQLKKSKETYLLHRQFSSFFHQNLCIMNNILGWYS